MFQPKAKMPIYVLTGIDYHSVTQTAAKIREFKLPEPYKGKGIRYYNEVIFYKQGKKSGM
jgi:large subunit ribosomal protein L6